MSKVDVIGRQKHTICCIEYPKLQRQLSLFLSPVYGALQICFFNF